MLRQAQQLLLILFCEIFSKKLVIFRKFIYLQPKLN